MTKEVLEAIATVRTYAERNPISWDERCARAKVDGEDAAIGDDENLRLIIPMGFRTVFSVEELAMVADQSVRKWFRHLSISMARPGRIPNEFSMQTIAAEFGFKGAWVDWEENGWIFAEHGRAINVIEPLEFKS